MHSLIPTLTILLVTTTLSTGQRLASTSICDYYANKLFGANNGTTQQLVQTLILNTAFIGNYTEPNVGITVPGIAPETVFNGTSVNLITYFDAAFYSTNDGVHDLGVAKLFLDDGGPVPLSMSQASNGNVTSNQYLLVTHVWQYFGLLLNCSKQGIDPDFPAYKGNPSMYEVHKYMDLTTFEQGWFVDQLTQAAASIGFSAEDTTIWFNTMTGLFSSRCSSPAVVGNLPPALNAICIHSSCPIAEGGDCRLYNNGKEAVAPGVANVTLAGDYTKTNGSAATATNASTGTTSSTTVQTAGAWKADHSGPFGLLIIGLVVLLAF